MRLRIKKSVILASTKLNLKKAFPRKADNEEIKNQIINLRKKFLEISSKLEKEDEEYKTLSDDIILLEQKFKKDPNDKSIEDLLTKVKNNIAGVAPDWAQLGALKIKKIGTDFNISLLNTKKGYRVAFKDMELTEPFWNKVSENIKNIKSSYLIPVKNKQYPTGSVILFLDSSNSTAFNAKSITDALKAVGVEKNIIDSATVATMNDPIKPKKGEQSSNSNDNYAITSGNYLIKDGFSSMPEHLFGNFLKVSRKNFNKKCAILKLDGKGSLTKIILKGGGLTDKFEVDTTTGLYQDIYTPESWGKKSKTFIFKKNGKFGVLRDNVSEFKEIVPAVYDNIRDFNSEGIAVVEKNGKKIVSKKNIDEFDDEFYKDKKIDSKIKDKILNYLKSTGLDEINLMIQISENGEVTYQPTVELNPETDYDKIDIPLTEKEIEKKEKEQLDLKTTLEDLKKAEERDPDSSTAKLLKEKINKLKKELEADYGVTFDEEKNEFLDDEEKKKNSNTQKERKNYLSYREILITAVKNKECLFCHFKKQIEKSSTDEPKKIIEIDELKKEFVVPTQPEDEVSTNTSTSKIFTGKQSNSTKLKIKLFYSKFFIKADEQPKDGEHEYITFLKKIILTTLGTEALNMKTIGSDLYNVNKEIGNLFLDSSKIKNASKTVSKNKLKISSFYKKSKPIKPKTEYTEEELPWNDVLHRFAIDHPEKFIKLIEVVNGDEPTLKDVKLNFSSFLEKNEVKYKINEDAVKEIIGSISEEKLKKLINYEEIKESILTQFNKFKNSNKILIKYPNEKNKNSLLAVNIYIKNFSKNHPYKTDAEREKIFEDLFFKNSEFQTVLNEGAAKDILINLLYDKKQSILRKTGYIPSEGSSIKISIPAGEQNVITELLKGELTNDTLKSDNTDNIDAKKEKLLALPLKITKDIAELLNKTKKFKEEAEGKFLFCEEHLEEYIKAKLSTKDKKFETFFEYIKMISQDIERGYSVYLKILDASKSETKPEDKKPNVQDESVSEPKPENKKPDVQDEAA